MATPAGPQPSYLFVVPFSLGSAQSDNRRDWRRVPRDSRAIPQRAKSLIVSGSYAR